jgi:hypothetical protein
MILKNVAIMHKRIYRFKYVNNVMNVAERDSFDLQVPEVLCM